MRNDMKHVIIDRPRAGGDGGRSIPSKGSKKRMNKIPLDEQPKTQSNAPVRLYGERAKELNEHLGPLVRWLRSRVGRDWDEVWSEVCEGLSVRNATTAHVRDHVSGYVERNCTVDSKGEVRDSVGLSLKNYRWFYVDPRDNTLRYNPDRSHRFNVTKKKDWVDGKDVYHRYYNLNGVWYEVTFEPVKCNCGRLKRLGMCGRGYVNCACRDVFYDVVTAARWKRKDAKYTGTEIHHLYKKHGLYICSISKRQLGKREIVKLGLRAVACAEA